MQRVRKRVLTGLRKRDKKDTFPPDPPFSLGGVRPPRPGSTRGPLHFQGLDLQPLHERSATNIGKVIAETGYNPLYLDIL